MKVSTNQALKDAHTAFGDLIRALAAIFFVIPFSKMKIILDSIDTFGAEVGIDLKKCLRICAITLYVFATIFIFSKLIGRALDIEADAQEQTSAEYHASFNSIAKGE